MVEQNKEWVVLKTMRVPIVNQFEDRTIEETAYLKVVMKKSSGFKLVALQKKGQKFRFPYKDLIPIIENLNALRILDPQINQQKLGENND